MGPAGSRSLRLGEEKLPETYRCLWRILPPPGNFLGLMSMRKGSVSRGSRLSLTLICPLLKPGTGPGWPGPAGPGWPRWLGIMGCWVPPAPTSCTPCCSPLSCSCPYLVLPSQFSSGMSPFLLVVWVMQGNARLQPPAPPPLLPPRPPSSSWLGKGEKASSKPQRRVIVLSAFKPCRMSLCHNFSSLGGAGKTLGHQRTPFPYRNRSSSFDLSPPYPLQINIYLYNQNLQGILRLIPPYVLGRFSLLSCFSLGGVFLAGGGVSSNLSMFIYLHATLRSPDAAGEGTQPILCQAGALKPATIKHLYFGGTQPAVCLLPRFILIQGVNLPGPTRLIC